MIKPSVRYHMVSPNCSVDHTPLIPGSPSRGPCPRVQTRHRIKSAPRRAKTACTGQPLNQNAGARTTLPVYASWELHRSPSVAPSMGNSTGSVCALCRSRRQTWVSLTTAWPRNRLVVQAERRPRRWPITNLSTYYLCGYGPQGCRTSVPSVYVKWAICPRGSTSSPGWDALALEPSTPRVVRRLYTGTPVASRGSVRKRDAPSVCARASFAGEPGRLRFSGTGCVDQGTYCYQVGRLALAGW